MLASVAAALLFPAFCFDAFFILSGLVRSKTAPVKRDARKSCLGAKERGGEINFLVLVERHQTVDVLAVVLPSVAVKMPELL